MQLEGFWRNGFQIHRQGAKPEPTETGSILVCALREKGASGAKCVRRPIQKDLRKEGRNFLQGGLIFNN